jgi:hypothetical protein
MKSKALHLARLFLIVLLTLLGLFTVMQTLPAQPPKHEPPINTANLVQLAAAAGRSYHQLSSRAPIRGKETVPMAVTERFFTGAAGDDRRITWNNRSKASNVS